jgi:hypothetical protein
MVFIAVLPSLAWRVFSIAAAAGLFARAAFVRATAKFRRLRVDEKGEGYET